MSLVSVIMPAYNCEDFISEAISSVCQQTYQEWELLIVDDCSLDNTVRIVSQFLGDSRIHLIKNDVNRGGAEARNIAIERASGDYIAFLDSDDLWDHSKLETQIKFMQLNNVGFCFSGYRVVYEGLDRVDNISVPKKVSFSQLLRHNYIGCLTAIYDSREFGKVYMLLVRKRQDFALWLELLKRFKYAYSVPEILGSYRVRPGTLSASKRDAFKYYWRVLRDVGQCSIVSASYNIGCYLLIVFFKKRLPNLYSKFFIRALG